MSKSSIFLIAGLALYWNFNGLSSSYLAVAVNPKPK